jgi:energy-coupling factor transporter ATP-binding protein EcfA2
VPRQPDRNAPSRARLGTCQTQGKINAIVSGLDVKNVSYSYDGVVNVLVEVSFSVEEGTIVGLVGPNGSGKSTLIKNIFDLVRLQEGAIRVGGHEHASAEAKSIPHDLLPDRPHGNHRSWSLDQDDRVFLIDWAQPVRGAAWLDVADLVPHLILAGHTAAAAEAVLADVPAWRDTDQAVITSYAAAFAGYWARSSRQPAPPGVPYLRSYQGRAAHAAVVWTAYRTGWA